MQTQNTLGSATANTAVVFFVTLILFTVLPTSALAQKKDPADEMKVAGTQPQNKTLVKTFTPPPNWKVEKNLTGVKGSGQNKLTAQELSTIDAGIVTPAIEQFMYNNGFSASGESVTVSSSQGKLTARSLTGANDTVNSEQVITRILVYGAVDSNEYCLVYKFVSNKQTGELLTGSVKSLDGDGYLADYKAGELFSIGSASQTMSIQGIDLNCLAKTLLSCSNAFTFAACFFSGGAACIDLIYSLLVDTACALTFTCQSAPLHIDSVQVSGNPTAGQQFYVSIIGTGFQTSNVRLVVTDNGACSNFGACVVPNNVLKSFGSVTSTSITHAPVTLSSGSHQLYVQNGFNGPTSNSYPLVVNGGGGSITTLSGAISKGQWWVGNFTVPSGKSSIKVTLNWSGTDDLDLHLTSASGIKYGYSENPTGYSGYWTHPEVIQLNGPTGGNWQLRVYGWSVVGSRSFTATVQVQ